MKKISLLKKIALGAGLLLFATSMSAKTIFLAGENNGGKWENDGLSASSPAVLHTVTLYGNSMMDGILEDKDVIVIMPGVNLIEEPINIEEFEVTIIGACTLNDVNFNASGNSIIDGGNETQLFSIANDANVTFGQLTFRNAKSEFGGGAAITVDAATAHIGNCGFINNAAVGSSDDLNAYGGAIRAVSGATVNLYDVVFDGNTAFRGGAISINGATLKAEYCYFQNNHTVYSDGEARGGVMFLSDATVTLSFCDIRGNSSTAGGGVFFIVGNSTTIINHSAIIGNNSGDRYNLETETGAGDNHGGVFYFGGTDPNTTIYNTTIANNFCKFDAVGGVLCWGGGTFTMINVTASGNFTYGNIDHCGGFKFTDNAKVNIYNCIIERNYTKADNSWSDIYFDPNNANIAINVEGSVCGATRAIDHDIIVSNDNSYLTYSYDPESKDDVEGNPNRNESGISIEGLVRNLCFPLKDNAPAKTLGWEELLFNYTDDDQFMNVRVPVSGKIYAGAVQILESNASSLVNPVRAANNPVYAAYGDTDICGVGIYDIAPDGSDAVVVGYYTILGQKLSNEPEKGLFIVKYSNGKSIKVLK